jgi:hypothetical protein
MSEARKIAESKMKAHWSNIFKGKWWGNPTAGDRTGPKIGMGKGPAWLDQHDAIVRSGRKIETLLNIGVGPNSNRGNPSVKWLSLYETIFPSIKNWVNLEIDQDAINRIKKTGEFKRYFTKVFLGDVKEIDKVDFGEPIDAILWSHGPEHVYRNEWEETFKKLSAIAPIVLINLPWGSGYNSEPTHYSPSVRRGEMEKFGFDVRYYGVEDTMQANMYGWKIR